MNNLIFKWLFWLSTIQITGTYNYYLYIGKIIEIFLNKSRNPYTLDYSKSMIDLYFMNLNINKFDTDS